MIDGSQHLGMGNGTLDFWGFMDWRIYVGLWTDRDSESWGSGCMGLGDPEFPGMSRGVDYFSNSRGPDYCATRVYIYIYI